ncbi:MAG TPA: 50S ribosomal protein L11 methyltransferase [Sphingomonas sp.]|nr:50S ribosomal protein L11 methyltransferase [Sphingomonas sp.]
MAPFDPVAFIRANLPVGPVPWIPEIRLHKASRSSGMGRLEGPQGGTAASPYWAYHWAGGLALARHILDHPEIVAGRRVLDLGAGSGLVAIAAAKAGAGEVLAAEIDPYAVAALGLNVALNNVAVGVAQTDPTVSPPPLVDLVLVGDLFYEDGLARRVMAFLDRCRAAAIEVLIGDPWRAFLPHQRLAVIADYDVAETESARMKRTGIFTIRQPSAAASIPL